MTTEELRKQSLEQFSVLRRRALFEAQQNIPITTAAAGSSSGGNGYNTGIFYGCANDGFIYDAVSLEKFVTYFPEGGGAQNTAFPGETLLCNSGEGYFYYLFYLVQDTYNGFYFGTIDSKTGAININNIGNLGDVAQNKTPASLYLEPSGNLIMLDNKNLGSNRNIIRIDTNYNDNGSWHGVLVNEVDAGTQPYGQLQSLFTANDNVYAISQLFDNVPIGLTIGKYDINEPGYVAGEAKELQMYKNGYRINNGGNFYEITIVSIVQGLDGLVYLSSFYTDPDTEGYEFGLFQVDLTTGYANWIKFAYVSGSITLLTLFTK
jgi:hypothetical protein